MGIPRPKRCTRSAKQTGAASCVLEQRRGTGERLPDRVVSFLGELGIDASSPYDDTSCELARTVSDRKGKLRVKRTRIRVTRWRVKLPGNGSLTALAQLATDASACGLTLYYAGIDGTLKVFSVNPFAAGMGPALGAKHSPGALRRAKARELAKDYADCDFLRAVYGEQWASCQLASKPILESLGELSLAMFGRELPSNWMEHASEWIADLQRWEGLQAAHERRIERELASSRDDASWEYWFACQRRLFDWQERCEREARQRKSLKSLPEAPKRKLREGQLSHNAEALAFRELANRIADDRRLASVRYFRAFGIACCADVYGTYVVDSVESYDYA